MSRMGEWFMEWREDDDLDLMLAALHHEEELEQQRQLEEQKCQTPTLIHPQSISLPSEPKTNSSTCGQPTETISAASWRPKNSFDGSF